MIFAIWLVFLCGGGIFLAPVNISLYAACAGLLGVALFIVAFVKGKARACVGEKSSGALRLNLPVTERFMAFMSFAASLQSGRCP